MARFDKRVAIITGAASGIGKEIALRFASEGGIPVIADLNLDAANATANEIKAKGSDAFAVAMNVVDEAQVEKGVADTVAKYGRVIYMGSVHSKEASKLKAPYVTAKHGLIGLAKVLAKEGAEYNVSANVVCPGFVRTPLVDKQIPEQAKELNISEDDVIKHVMLKDTVDGQFTTTDEVADAVLFFAAAKSTAFTGQSAVVSHGWFMQ